MGIESLGACDGSGRSAVLLPLALVIFSGWACSPGALQPYGQGCSALTGTVVALSKILYMGWGLHPEGWSFTGLSGHSALSMLVWPTIGMLLAVSRRRFWRRLAGGRRAVGGDYGVAAGHRCPHACPKQCLALFGAAFSLERSSSSQGNAGPPQFP